MTDLERLQFRATEIRRELSQENCTEDRERELIAEYRSVDSGIQREMILQDTLQESNHEGEEVDEEDTEGIEYRELLTNSSAGEIFDYVINASQVEGATRELQQHHGLGRNQVPLSLIFGSSIEERAVTPAPATTGLDQQTIEPAVFPAMYADFLNIPMPRVPVGQPLYPDVAKSAQAKGPYTDSTSVAETTGSFNTVSIEPARFQASFFYRRTDAAKFAGMDSALRQNLNQALGDKIDNYILTQLQGDSTITKRTAPTKAADDSYAILRTLFLHGRVEGKWAPNEMALKHVVGTDVYAKLAALYRDGSATDVTLLDYITMKSGGIQVSAQLAAAASNVATSITRVGMRRDAVAPMWEGITLINDEITKAATGEIVITAFMLANFKVLRAEGFYLPTVWIP
ncbi:MAG: hypothetical protein F4118_10575 [Acidimicrobiaceae bacterium]|nr:hypothetical protein [Candidatus Poribacteria bacterium]MYI36854.1 hypothetical protein [Acidimicrobiaceae bacterium]